MGLSVESDFPDIKQANRFLLESLRRPGPPAPPGLTFPEAVPAGGPRAPAARASPMG